MMKKRKFVLLNEADNILVYCQKVSADECVKLSKIELKFDSNIDNHKVSYI
jgi:hypothetical protein